MQEADACAVHGVERQLQPRPPGGGALGRRRSASSCELIRDCGRRLPTETRLACLIPQREGRPPVAELCAEHSNVFTPGTAVVAHAASRAPMMRASLHAYGRTRELRSRDSCAAVPLVLLLAPLDLAGGGEPRE